MKALARLFPWSLAFCMLAGTTTPDATAGVYTVSSCHFRDGTPAPTHLLRAVGPKTGVLYDLSCTDGSGVGVRLTGLAEGCPVGDAAGLETRAAAGLVIDAAAVRGPKMGPPGVRLVALGRLLSARTPGAANWRGS